MKPITDNLGRVDYADWVSEVDQRVLDIAGMGIWDLPDQEYFEWFQADISVDDAAHRALAAVGFPNGKENA